MDPRLLDQALLRRRALLDRLAAEGTDAFRLFHGTAEGLPGLTVDRYGPLVLAQTFRESLRPEEAGALEGALRERLSFPFVFAYNHRAKTPRQPFDLWHRPAPEALAELECREGGLRFLVRARHQGLDPWLFLDLRSGRRALRGSAAGRDVLNLFAYTCSAGVCAAAAGAREVWNVDFAGSSLEVGRRNAALNGVPPERFRTIQEDCLPAARQLAGLPAGGRRGRRAPLRFPPSMEHMRLQGRRPGFLKLEPRAFDIVFLDPPAWAKGSFGAVDIEGDYPSLFKPALLAARPGGLVIATNHSASVRLDEWLGTLERCARKAGRPLRSVRTVAPDEDFPSFDGSPPLKTAVCEV